MTPPHRGSFLEMGYLERFEMPTNANKIDFQRFLKNRFYPYNIRILCEKTPYFDK